MNPIILSALITAVSSIVAAYIGRKTGEVAGHKRGREQGEREGRRRGHTQGLEEGREQGEKEAQQLFQQRLEAAPILYTQKLDELIVGGLKEGENEAQVNARAIVRTRDNLRGSSETIASSLNGEIDQLAQELQSTASEEELRQTIKVLAKVWPSKKLQIQIEIRKVIAELGLEVVHKQDALYQEQEASSRNSESRREFYN